MNDYKINSRLKLAMKLLNHNTCVVCSRSPGKLYMNTNSINIYFRCDDPDCQPVATVKEATLEEYEVMLIMDE